jgi:hypothetical protein
VALVVLGLLGFALLESGAGRGATYSLAVDQLERWPLLNACQLDLNMAVLGPTHGQAQGSFDPVTVAWTQSRVGSAGDVGDYKEFVKAVQGYVNERIPHPGWTMAQYAITGRNCVQTIRPDPSWHPLSPFRQLRFCANDGDCTTVALELGTNAIRFIASYDPLQNTYPSRDLVDKLWLEFGTDRASARHYAEALRKTGISVRWDQRDAASLQYRLRCVSPSLGCVVETHPSPDGRR